MAKYVIELDKEACIGCGACIAACDNFVKSGDKAKVVNSEVDEIGSNKEAAEICPVTCIKITKKE